MSAADDRLAQHDEKIRRWRAFLVDHMPAMDRADPPLACIDESLKIAGLVEGEAPAGMAVPDEVFLEYVLPYAHLDEARGLWREEFFWRFAADARRAASIEDAVRFLDRAIWTELGVTYHATKRTHDNMSVAESRATGYASCTGLSILLANLCRAVGIPARLAGTPQWTDGSGNHTWVEVWDHGTWRIVGATEPDPFDRAWFNEKASACAESPDHGIWAARWSASDTHFPLFWNPSYAGVPAVRRDETYATLPPPPRHPTRIVTEPRRYTAPRIERPLEISGRMDDPQWRDVPWTARFLDIEGHRKPTPRFETRAKMCWDDTYFYVGAYLEDPHVVATLTEKNAIIFNDPDFEIFIDPDGDNHDYYEFEINALGTIWELNLERPYRDDGPIHRGHNLDGVISAVHVDGTINDPSDLDRGWSVEVAIPWASLAPFARGMACPPEDGNTWRVNFSRVHWLFDILADGYRKVPREAHPEDNWVWSPQDAIDMHRPEKFGYVMFSAEAPGPELPACPRDPTGPARERLMAAYYVLRESPGEALDGAAVEARIPGPRPEGVGPLHV
ncbi:MAG: transglutaminase domain-containing protein, partial [Planctomycetota bacterium]|nr:transglutaminase domain-containing protein [Planctomycetota bacterium]